MIIGGLEMKNCLRHTEGATNEEIQAQQVESKGLDIQCTLKKLKSLKNPSVFCLEIKQAQVASRVINLSFKLM